MTGLHNNGWLLGWVGHYIVTYRDIKSPHCTPESNITNNILHTNDT